MEESLFSRQYGACIRALRAADFGHEWDPKHHRCFLCGVPICFHLGVVEQHREVCPNGHLGCRPEPGKLK